MIEEMERDEKWGWGFLATSVVAAEVVFYKAGDWIGNKTAYGIENAMNTIDTFRHNLGTALEPQHLEQMVYSEPVAAWGITGGILTAGLGLYGLFQSTPYWIEYPFRAASSLFKRKHTPGAPL